MHDDALVGKFDGAASWIAQISWSGSGTGK
jgi:hypothetical protein